MKLSDLVKVILKKIVLIVLVSVIITAIASISVFSDANRVHNSKSVMKLEGTYMANGAEPFKVKTEYIISKLPSIVFECTTVSFHEKVIMKMQEIRPDKYKNLTNKQIASSFTVSSIKDTTHLIINTQSTDKAFSLDLCQAVNKALLAMNGVEIDGDIVGAYDDGLMKFESIDDAYYIGTSTGSAIIKLVIILLVCLILGVVIELIYSLALPYANNRVATEITVKTNQIAVLNKQNWYEDLKELTNFSAKKGGNK